MAMGTVILRASALLALLVLLVLGTVSPAAASGVSLGVDTDLDGELLLTDHHITPDSPKSVAVEAQNTGSKSFTGRIRLDVSTVQNRTIFRTWSDVIQLTPGSRTSHRLWFYRPHHNGTLTASVVLHHGIDRVTESFTVNTTVRDTRNGFELHTLRARKNSIRAVITVPNDVDAFTVTVDDASTRRYAQQRVRPSGDRTTVTVPYHPTIQDTAETTITIMSMDGRYHYTAKRTVTRKTGTFTRLTGWVAGMVENLPFT